MVQKLLLVPNMSLSSTNLSAFILLSWKKCLNGDVAGMQGLSYLCSLGRKSSNVIMDVFSRCIQMASSIGGNLPLLEILKS